MQRCAPPAHRTAVHMQLTNTAPFRTRQACQRASCAPRRCLVASALLKVADGVNARWSQTRSALQLRVVLEEGVRGRDIKLEVLRKRMKLTINGGSVVEGTFDHAEGVDPDGSFFEVEEEQGPGGVSCRVALVTMAKAEVARDDMGYVTWDRLLESDRPDKTITHRVYMDLTINSQAAGRLIIGLYGNMVPKAVENFRSLCAGDSATGLTYQGTALHRVMPGFLLMGGDVKRGDGSGGGASIYEAPFEDENFALQHEREGVVSMASVGQNANTSLFQISLGQLPFLDGKHVVFGRVLHGLNVLRSVESVPCSSGDRPSVPITISSCGEISQEQYESIEVSLEPEPQPRDLSMPTLVQQLSSSASASSTAGDGITKGGPKGAAAIGGPMPGGASSTRKRGGGAVADIGSLSELLGVEGGLSADELLKRANLDHLDVDSGSQQGPKNR